MKNCSTCCVLVGLLASSWLASGCCKALKGEKQDAASSSSASATAASSAAGASSVSGGQADKVGPVVQIPAGTLVAGTPCPQAPRVTNEELPGTRIPMTAFDIDMYPYPNDPALPPKTNVTRAEAERLCRARGRRLCTELEWERACKGPSNLTYPWGNKYSKSNPCQSKGGAVLLSSKSYEACQSGFGVKALYGAVWEWTASPWGRGSSSGKATVRGGPAKNNYVQARCANGQARVPSSSYGDVGFRCCGGPVNTAQVNLPVDRRDVLTSDPSVDPSLARSLIRALPSSMQHVNGFSIDIEKVWRWHPRANEEMIVASYRASKSAGGGRFYHPLVFHRCGNRTWRVAKLRGPVERMQPPTSGSNPQVLTVHVSTGSDSGDVRFRYHYGFVSVQQPAWIQAGNSLDTGPKFKLPVGSKHKGGFRLPVFKK